MKNILIAATIVGAAAAALIIYLKRNTGTEGALNDVSDAAGRAYKTMNRNLGRVERKTDHALI